MTATKACIRHTCFDIQISLNPLACTRMKGKVLKTYRGIFCFSDEYLVRKQLLCGRKMQGTIHVRSLMEKGSFTSDSLDESDSVFVLVVFRFCLKKRQWNNCCFVCRESRQIDAAHSIASKQIVDFETGC